MKELIDKAEVVAEIKSLMCPTFTNFDEGVNAAAKTLLESIDTLEVKEADYNDCIHKDAFIDKACEWLNNNLPLYFEQVNVDNTDRFIRIFKKAMEEQQRAE